MNAAEQITSACANLVTAGNALDAATTAYDVYIENGFALDLNFVPDADAEAAIAQANAQAAFDAANAQCATARNNAGNHDAAVAAAEANLAFAEAALAELADGASAEQIAIAQAQLGQARTQLEQASAALARASLVAPFAGVITAVSIEQGQPASSATPAITLVDNSAYHLSVNIDELDVMRLQVGQSATVALEALDGQVIPGTVARIAPAANANQGVVTYNVRVDLMTDGDQMSLRIGMAADVEIVVGTFEDVFVVDSAAIQRDGDQEYLIGLGNIILPVTTGLSRDGLTVVDGQLTEGQLVYLEPPTTTALGGGRLGFRPPLGGGS